MVLPLGEFNHLGWFHYTLAWFRSQLFGQAVCAVVAWLRYPSCALALVKRYSSLMVPSLNRLSEVLDVRSKFRR